MDFDVKPATSEGCPVDNEGKKVDLTMAFVGTCAEGQLGRPRAASTAR
jgi:hypothetical protein